MIWLLRNLLPFLLLALMAQRLVRPRLGKFGIFELFVVNAIGDLAAHAAFEDQHPLLPGLGSLLVWGLAIGGLGWLAARWGWLGRFVYGKPQVLVRDGQPDLAALGAVRMSLAELESALRKQNLNGLDQVQEATLEPSGDVTAVKAQSVSHELKQISAALAALAERLPQ